MLGSGSSLIFQMSADRKSPRIRDQVHSGISHIICRLYLTAVGLDTYIRIAESIYHQRMLVLLRALLSACCGEAVSASLCFILSRPVCNISFPLFLFKNHMNSTSSNNYRLPHSSFTNYDTSRCLKSIKKTCCLHPYFYGVTYSTQPCLTWHRGLHAQMIKCRFAVSTCLLLVMPGLGLAKISRLHSAVEEPTYVSFF